MRIGGSEGVERWDRRPAEGGAGAWPGNAVMDLGLVLQTTPPSARVVDLAKRAEAYGFTHVWTFDCHILWQEPYVIYSQILAETRNVVVGPMVTNPATRDWTVTASTFATLNEMYGNRTVCGIGRGDSAVRVTNGKPTTLDTLRESVHVIRELANGRSVDYKGSTITFPWAVASRARGVGRRLRAEGAGARRRGRRRVHPPARRPADRRVDDRRRARGGRATPAATPTTSRSASPPRPTSATTSPTCATSAAGSAGWSATTSPTSSAATATRPTCRPRSPTTSRAARATTTTSTARPATSHAVRARRDRRPLLHPRPGRRAAAPAARAARARRRPVRHLPPARRQGRHPAGLRRARHPGRLAEHGRAKT